MRSIDAGRPGTESVDMAGPGWIVLAVVMTAVAGFAFGFLSGVHVAPDVCVEVIDVGVGEPVLAGSRGVTRG